MSLSEQIETTTEKAIVHLAGALSCTHINCTTHCVTNIEGWNASDDNLKAIAEYLVGLRACAIDAALNIQAFLDDTKNERVDLCKSVMHIVGESNDALNESKIEDERNPWIAEGLWHLCMAVGARRPEIHLNGKIILLDYAHVNPKDHGLDVTAIYLADNDEVGISLVETKAYRNNPNAAISAAARFFREVDEGKHSPRIRQHVQIMRTALPPDLSKLITPSFWQQNRTYIPNPHYDIEKTVDWSNHRPSLNSLKRPKEERIIMPHEISGFQSFFDRISEHMREFVRGL